MSQRLPPLNPLRAFEATARHLSVTRAARELRVTHGAVSHQIRTLETAMQVRLFKREGGRLRLSPQGAALLPAVSLAFESIAEATAAITRPSTSGDLAVSCVPAFLALWLLPRLNSFTAQLPGVRLRLSASNSARDIYSPDVDLCIRYGDGNWPDCWVRLLTPLELFPVCAPGLANNCPLRAVGNLAEHVLLHADDGKEWQSWLAAADAVELARGRHHFFSGAHLAIEAAIHGHGVALGDTITTSRLLSAGRLVMPFDLAVPAVDCFYLACRSENRTAPIVRAFIDWLYAELGEAAGRLPAAGERRRRAGSTGRRRSARP